MKLFMVFFALIVAIVGFASAIICARNNRSGMLQNFIDEYAMQTAKESGGGELVWFYFIDDKKFL